MFQTTNQNTFIKRELGHFGGIAVGTDSSHTFLLCVVQEKNQTHTVFLCFWG